MSIPRTTKLVDPPWDKAADSSASPYADAAGVLTGSFTYSRPRRPVIRATWLGWLLIATPWVAFLLWVAMEMYP